MDICPFCYNKLTPVDKRFYTSTYQQIKDCDYCIEISDKMSRFLVRWNKNLTKIELIYFCICINNQEIIIWNDIKENETSIETLIQNGEWIYVGPLINFDYSSPARIIDKIKLLMTFC